MSSLSGDALSSSDECAGHRLFQRRGDLRVGARRHEIRLAVAPLDLQIVAERPLRDVGILAEVPGHYRRGTAEVDFSGLAESSSGSDVLSAVLAACIAPGDVNR